MANTDLIRCVNATGRRGMGRISRLIWEDAVKDIWKAGVCPESAIHMSKPWTGLWDPLITIIDVLYIYDSFSFLFLFLVVAGSCWLWVQACLNMMLGTKTLCCCNSYWYCCCYKYFWLFYTWGTICALIFFYMVKWNNKSFFISTSGPLCQKIWMKRFEIKTSHKLNNHY
jgi:hypothetical protein